MNTQKVELRELCALITKGSTPTSIGFDFSDSGVGFLRVQNVSGGQVNHLRDTLFIAPAVHTELRRSQIAPGDILLSIAGTIGRTGVVPNDAPPLNCNQALAIIRTTDKVFRPFLRHWLESFDAQTQMRGSAVTGTIQNLSLAQVGNLKVPTPTLPEQRRIAAILDQADALRAKRREALAQLGSLTQSIFIEMFGDPVTNPKGWPIASLHELMDASGPQNGLYKPSSDYGSGTPILRIDAFYDGKVTKLDILKRVRLSDTELNLYGLREDDIVINRVNSIEYLGKSALIPPLSETTVFESNMMRFTLRRGVVNPIYVVQFFQTKFIKNQILSCSKNAVNQSSINQQDVKGFQVHVPPLHLQQAFATRIQSVEALKVTQNAGLQELDRLFASLQHRAFQGEL